VRVRSRCQYAKRAQVQSHVEVPDFGPDPTTLDLDPDSVVPSPTPPPDLVPIPTPDLAPARKPSTKNPTSTPPRITCVAYGKACINAKAVPALDALCRTTVSTRGKRGCRLFMCSPGTKEDDA